MLFDLLRFPLELVEEGRIHLRRRVEAGLRVLLVEVSELVLKPCLLFTNVERVALHIDLFCEIFGVFEPA